MGQTSRQEMVQEITELVAGQKKLASMLREQQKKLPTPDQVRDIEKMREEITQKMASYGIIPPDSTRRFRETLDQPGGVEFLIDQLLDHAKEQKTASSGEEPSSMLGSVSDKQVGSQPKRNMATYINQPGASRLNQPTYQNPYHC
jgi:transcription initiation factor TFIIIB Brf1 subunit/transcription initiation factor TFIIB